MIFIPRHLYEGMQPKSGWERRARREWTQRWDIYRRYYEVISPLLPAFVRRLCYNTLHDAIVESAEQGNGTIAFVLDARKGLGGFRGRRVRLEFADLRRWVSIRRLPGQCWLYEEAHLSSRARFSLHVMFDLNDVENEADKLSIRSALSQ